MNLREASPESSPAWLLSIRVVLWEEPKRLGCLLKCKNQSIKQAISTHRSPPEFTRSVSRSLQTGSRAKHIWLDLSEKKKFFFPQHRSATSDSWDERCCKMMWEVMQKKTVKAQQHNLVSIWEANRQIIPLINLSCFYYHLSTSNQACFRDFPNMYQNKLKIPKALILPPSSWKTLLSLLIVLRLKTEFRVDDTQIFVLWS